MRSRSALLAFSPGVLLAAGCGHVVDVDLTSDAGPGASASSSSPPSSASSSIDAVVATEGDTRSGLTFTDPKSGAVSFEYDTNTDESWKPLPSDRLIQGLTNGSKYRFRVRAVTANGPASPSPPSNEVVPYGVPESPTVTVRQEHMTITWTWTARSSNGRKFAGYRTKLDVALWASTNEKTLSRAFAYGQSHTLCAAVVTDGADGRNTSVEECAPITVELPKVTAENTADGFTSAIAGGTRFDDEVKANSSYAISGACFTSSDIGSNNGWWYRLQSSGHWVAATNFALKMNQFMAPRANGGSGCN
jgi:large repetitive protein